MRERIVSKSAIREVSVQEVAKGLGEGRYLLVDVRELSEVSAESYPDSVVVPLSSFDAREIPAPNGRDVVFACRSGKRSMTALQAAQAQGFDFHLNLQGGILAWKAAGLPTKQG